MTSCRDELFLFFKVSVLLKLFQSRPSLEEQNEIQIKRQKGLTSITKFHFHWAFFFSWEGKKLSFKLA